MQELCTDSTCSSLILFTEVITKRKAVFIDRQGPTLDRKGKIAMSDQVLKLALLIRRGPIEGTSAAGEGSGFGSGSGTWPFDASRAARRLPRDSETAVACRRGGLPDHKSRGGPTAWARSLSPRPPCPGTCRLRAEGLTTRWLPAPSVHAVSAAGPGSVCACPALRGKSPVDLPLRAPGRHLSAGFDCLPGLSANQRGLVSKRPTKTQK
ncbi:UNVERIFIED_CONTAM: hypothetical protein FKN15_068252 [Acipenser sinensis]